MAPLNILILTDGKMGDLMQCRGVAQALSEPDKISEIVLKPDFPYSLPLPGIPVQTAHREGKPDSPFNPPHPDIVIASGRRMVPYLARFKKLREPDKAPFTVFLKDPRAKYDDMDFIWAPAHDNLQGKNVFTTVTSPHTITGERLKTASKLAAIRFKSTRSPSAGIILGGDSKTVTWNNTSIGQFTAHLSRLPQDTTILITPSRRTPAKLSAAVKSALKEYNTWFWNGEGDNPYLEILSHCDRLIITGDSHNMVSEALAAGTPVHVFRPPGLNKKLISFLDQIERDGFTENTKNGFERTTAKPIDATPVIATEILQRYKIEQNG